ncbi:MAG: alpha-L-fucosidase [Kiritimatiellia bacterium]|jgi:hypothetical protein|nr:alpha-L-fucosidase [Kiritimatiellia bacterium]
MLTRKGFLFSVSAAAVCGAAEAAKAYAAPARQPFDIQRYRPAMDRFASRRWGVFNHFLCDGKDTWRGREYAGAAAAWNARVNEVDVKKLARDLKEMGAGYFFLTLMQGSKFMIAPNAAYDEIIGAKPGEACAERDLPMEIADELAKHGIDFCLYYTGDGPWKDDVAGHRMGLWDPRDKVRVSDPYVKRWTSVLEEYAVRYGDRVKAWWIDGMYSEYINFYKPHHLNFYHDAIRKGNPTALVANNNGVKPKYVKYGAEDTFTCGEFNDFTVLPPARFIDGAQSHILAPLGFDPKRPAAAGWASPGCKHTKEYMAGFVRLANLVGMPVTIDIQCFGASRANAFDPEQREALKWVSANLS